ncbi:MAG: hypothetical protein JWM80_5066 [Cyanobacteria bacterium RYN_339]|nr:hypothetical protein [Cyanobacteria bacterium RYN_339]
MSRRLVLSLVAISLLAGCGTSPATSSVKRQHLDGATAPSVKTVVGVPGIAPTVSVKAEVAAAAPAVALRSQDSTADVVEMDSNLESVELLSPNGAGYKVQGWFGDMVDTIKDAYKRWKLSREVKAALKHKDDQAFNLHEGEIDTMKKDRTAPVTKIKTLANGDQEIVTTWDSTFKGTWHVETARIVDGDGTTQVLAVSLSGTDKSGRASTVTRTRKLTGANGAYEVATDRTSTAKDGRKEVQHWVKSVLVDGSEKLDGYIDFADGWRTQISGTRDTAGKVKVDVTKIAPADKPDTGATGAADPAATGAAS